MQSGEEKWQAGKQVRLINDPQRIGTLTDGICRKRGDRQFYLVLFSDKPAPQLIPKDQLEPLPEAPMHPLDLLNTGKLGTPEVLRRTLIHVRLTGRLADIIYSMEATDTDFYAYQFKPVLKLLQTPTNSLMIADEVGMGKTIEAGLIWTELRSRFNLKRLVVLCPAALREKWRDELVNKIGVSPEICKAKDTLRILQDRQAHVRGFAIIASIQGLLPQRGWDDAEDDAADVDKLARLLKEKEHEEHLIDLLVVDEAHYMRNPATQTNRLGQLMRGVSDYRVLLTATPIHNYNRDLFSLLHLLDPDTFERRDDFDEILRANEPLVRVRDLVLKGKSSPDELASVLSEARNNRLLQDNRQLKTLLDQIEDASPDSPTKRSRIAYRLETINLLGHTITRTRKRDVKEWRVVRQPIPKFIPMTEIERKFYDTVTDIVGTYAEENDINEAFLLAQPQRQMASCMPAALKSWQERRIEIPEDQLSGTDLDARQRQELGPLTEELVNNSGEFVAFDELANSDSKYIRLREILQEFFVNHPKDKVIVFSTFLGTLDYLKERLDDDGISSIVLRGGGSRPKYDIIQEFRSPKGPSVMLSSEVGGEGVDLQFSWVVINYDLPWNPMRVEQRIGRVDRLGQESDKVLIWNLFYADTIDARIYECLYDKLDLCRNALGDFEAILGEEIEKLTRDLVLGHLSPEQQEERINQTTQALETRKQEEERLEANAAHLVAYGDYILQQVKAAHDMNRWINGTDLLAYVTDFLSANYPGYVLKETDGQNHEYELSLNSEARHALSEFIRLNNLSGQTQLDQYSARPIVCRFKNRVLAGKPERKETISQFHPLVRFISDRISKTVPQLRPAVSVKVSRCDLDISLGLGVYVLAASLWLIKGLRDVEKLVYAAVPLDRPETLLGEDDAERLAITCAAKGRHWLEVGHQCELQQVHHIANDVLFGTLYDRFERYIEEERNQNEDRADIQERHRHRHFSRQKEVIERTLRNFRETGRNRMIPATEGRLRSLDDWGERKRREIESRRKITSDSEEIFVAVVLIE